MIYTTLNKIRAHNPCSNGWAKLLKSLGKTAPDDEPLALLTILESNGLQDTIWCFRACPEHTQIWAAFTKWCADQVAHLRNENANTAHTAPLATDVAAGYADAARYAYAAVRYAAYAARYAARCAVADVADASAWAAARCAEREKQRLKLIEILNNPESYEELLK
jgi:hypothetical protein